ncbi:hypothetical protein PR048_014208, partial [Dryococelus australis]
MTGRVDGLQKKVRENYSSGIFIHSCAYRFNLLILQSLNVICCKIFLKHQAGIQIKTDKIIKHSPRKLCLFKIILKGITFIRLSGIAQIVFFNSYHPSNKFICRTPFFLTENNRDMHKKLPETIQTIKSWTVLCEQKLLLALKQKKSSCSE